MVMKKIVVVGGGTGVPVVLKGLRDHCVDLVAVVSMVDDGGSTGRIRSEFNILPPGDIRRSICALSGAEDTLLKLFNYRFEKGTLAGHSFGNLLLASLREMTGDENKAIQEASKLMKVRGKVLPVTLDDSKLCAELEDGQLIVGETNIDIPKHDANLKIKRVFVTPKARANDLVLEEIRSADLIVIGPGDLYTSIIPNLLIEGIPEAIEKSSAKKVYVCNLMTKHGETDGFSVSNFVSEIEEYLGKDILDFVIYNSGIYGLEILKKYKLENASQVKKDKKTLSKFSCQFIGGRVTTKSEQIRHDSKKIARIILGLLIDEEIATFDSDNKYSNHN